MKEQKDFDSIDSIFRDAFASQSEQPSASGWDTPSPKVWEGIKAEMPKTPPASNAFLKFGTFIVAAAVVGAAAYFLLKPKPSALNATQEHAVPVQITPSNDSGAAFPAANNNASEKGIKATESAPSNVSIEPKKADNAPKPAEYSQPASKKASKNSVKKPVEQPVSVKPVVTEPKPAPPVNSSQKNKGAAPPKNSLEKNGGKE